MADIETSGGGLLVFALAIVACGVLAAMVMIAMGVLP